MKLFSRFMPSSGMRQVPKSVTIHAVLLAYTVIALFPIVVVVINAFKER